MTFVIRGQARPAEAPDDAPVYYTWFEVVPLKIVAWDYGVRREITYAGA